MAKAQIGTHIDKEIRDAFCRKCKQDGLKIYEVIEALFKLYLSGQVIVKTEARAVFTGREEDK